MYKINNFKQATSNKQSYHFLKLCLLLIFSTFYYYCGNTDPSGNTDSPDITNLSVTEIATSTLLTWTDPTDSTFKEVKITYASGEKVIAKGIERAEISGLNQNGTDTFTLNALDEAGESISTIEQTEKVLDQAIRVSTGSSNIGYIDLPSDVVRYPTLPTAMYTIPINSVDYTLTLTRNSTNVQDIDIEVTNPMSGDVFRHRIVNCSTGSTIQVLAGNITGISSGFTTNSDMFTFIGLSNLEASHAVAMYLNSRSTNSVCFRLAVRVGAIFVDNTSVRATVNIEYHKPLGTKINFSTTHSFFSVDQKTGLITLSSGGMVDINVQSLYIMEAENGSDSPILIGIEVTR